eukprot:g2821.t1
MSRYVGSIDQGTTSTRFIVFDSAGNVVTVDQQEFEQIMPKPGWVEHDPVEIWATTKSVIAGAMEKASLSAADFAAVGITNQRETTVVWDRRTGKPLYNALVWMTTHTEELCAELEAKGGKDRFRAKTGLPVATYFSATKIRWILDNVAGARELAESGDALFGNTDSWLVWNLTGGPDGGLHITDVTNASRTQLMDLATLDWDDGLLAEFGIPRSMLPAIRSSSERYGDIVPSAPVPKATGDGAGDARSGVDVLAGVCVAACMGDQQAALFGQTCFDSGEAKNTYGTGCFLLMNTGTSPIPSTRGLLTTVAYKLGDAPAVYALEGSVAIAGALVQWLRDNLEMIKDASEIESIAASVDDNGGCYIVPAFGGLYAPHWRPDARGVFAGLTRFVTRAHVCRAALEAICFQANELFSAMVADSGVELKELKVDGGATVNSLMMQFQSDVLGVPVVRPACPEATAQGAAYAAGLAVGFWNDLEQLRSNWKAEQSFKPTMESKRRDELVSGWNKAVQRSLDWVETSSL